jgi:hypothetical protein
MKAVKVEMDGSIKLPEEMLRLFPTSTELAVWTEGDTIILKRLQPLKPSQIAERVQEKEAPPKDIVSEVHRMRLGMVKSRAKTGVVPNTKVEGRAPS